MTERNEATKRLKQTPPVLVCLLATGLLLGGCVAPQAEPADRHVTHDHHIVLPPDSITWQDGPGSLPAGARFAVLQGDLAEREFIALRLQFPPHYEIPPHWHEAVEHVTVLEGTLYIGKGSDVDKDAADALPAGSYSVVPNEEPHYAFTLDEGVVFQLHSIGPWGITYVNPDDDPRHGA